MEFHRSAVLCNNELDEFSTVAPVNLPADPYYERPITSSEHEMPLICEYISPH